MMIISSGLNVVVESCDVGSGLFPQARLCAGSAVINVVIDIDGRGVFVDLGFVHRDGAVRSGVDDVVGKNIVGHIPLHLEFSGTGLRRIIFVERVVDHGAVIGVSALRRVASDGNGRGVAVIDKIISRGDVTGGAVFVLAGQLDSEIHIVHDVLFDQDPGATVHVNAVGILFVAVGRIAARGNVVNPIAAHDSVASLVDGGVGRGALETDDVDSDVVVVVDNIVRNPEVRNVPVHYQRFAGTGLKMMNFIAVDNQFADRSFGVGPVDGNAKSVGAVSRTVAAFESLLNMMDVVLEQFDMGSGSDNADA